MVNQLVYDGGVLTQDKKSLVNVKEVTVENDVVISSVSKSFSSEWHQYLGNYESEERALEILQKIVAEIADGSGLSVIFSMTKK